MPFEWGLMVEGHAEREQKIKRREAGWVALLLSAQCGQHYTAAQLLGEEPVDEASAEDRAEQYERELAKKLKRKAREQAKGGKADEAKVPGGV